MNERKKRRFHAINSNSSKPHLGGHFNTTHVDKGALKWMKDKLQAKRLVDIGCGPGDQVLTARNLGYDAIGIDGDEELLKNEWSSIDDILIHDYTKGTPEIKGKYDVGWCVEFLEHVEEKYQKNYMKTFQQCKYIICTAAEPGEPGWHHVNCQSKKYWDNIFNEYGFDFSEKLTKRLRKHSSMNIKKKERKQFIRRRGWVFINRRFNNELNNENTI